MKGSPTPRPRSRVVATLVHDYDRHSGESRIVMLEGVRLASAALLCAEVCAEFALSDRIERQGVTAIRMVVID